MSASWSLSERVLVIRRAAQAFGTFAFGMLAALPVAAAQQPAKEMSRSGLDRLGGHKLEGRGGVEMVEEQDKILAGIRSGGDEESLEPGRVGETAEFLGQAPIWTSEVLWAKTQGVEDVGIGQIEHPVNFNMDLRQDEGAERPATRRLSDLCRADRGGFPAIEGTELPLGVVAPTVQATAFRVQDAALKMAVDDPVDVPSERSGGQPSNGRWPARLRRHVNPAAARLRGDAPFDPPQEVSHLFEAPRGPQAFQRRLAP